MPKLVYATRGWKKLQREYIADDLHTLRRGKLDELLLRRESSGFSCEEAVMYYASLSFLSAQCAVSRYMQTGVLDQAACWFCLSAEARRTADALLPHNPRREAARVAALPADDLAAALLCGNLPAALDRLDAVRAALDLEKAPSQGGRPPSRTDQRQDQRRRQRLTLACDLYGNLLQDRDSQAREALPALDGLGWDPLCSRCLHALLEGDGAGFTDALSQHMRDFRAAPTPGELNCAVLFWEGLWQRRGGTPPLDLADAPRALLDLPPCDPSQLSETLGLPLPSFDPALILQHVDINRVGPRFTSL